MYDLFTRSVERAVLASGFADESYPLIRMHRNDSRFGPAVARLRRDGRLFVVDSQSRGAWYLSPTAMASLLVHSDRDYEVTEQERTELHALFVRAAALTPGGVTADGRLNVLGYDAVVFDLGGVIVDESDLDAAICQHFEDHLPRGSKWKSYSQYANELERRSDPRWYDYFAQAADLGFESDLVARLHSNLISAVRFFPFAVEFVQWLKNQSVRLFVVTGCNSQVLNLRLEAYGLTGVFEASVTSDRGGELGNKEPSFETLLQQTGLKPDRILLITDGYTKDVLPALKFGLVPLLFVTGGRRNRAFKSDGVMPGDEIVLAMMANQKRTAAEFLFTDFRKLYS